MTSSAIVSLVLVAVGVILILIGAYLSLADRAGKRGALPEVLSGLTKLLEAMKDYPAGQRLIVFGILVLILAGIWGGIGGFVEKATS